jgi:hypothetical protein
MVAGGVPGAVVGYPFMHRMKLGPYGITIQSRFLTGQLGRLVTTTNGAREGERRCYHIRASDTDDPFG